jgi:hypothetical protein
MPIEMHDSTLEYWDYMNNLMPGAYFLQNRGGYVVPRIRLMATALPTFLQDWRTPTKLIYYHSSTEGILNTITLIESLLPAADKAARTYGVDYVILPFVAGFDLGWDAWCSNPKGVTPTDFFGTPLDDLPIFDDLNDGRDIEYVRGAELMVEAAIRVFCETYGMKMISGASIGGFDRNVGPYYPHYVVTYMFGEFSMELEQLLNYPGLTMRTYAAKATYSLMMWGIIITLNVCYFMDRRGIEQAAAAGLRKKES